jgi:hypothetical protein
VQHGHRECVPLIQRWQGMRIRDLPPCRLHERQRESGSPLCDAPRLGGCGDALDGSESLRRPATLINEPSNLNTPPLAALQSVVAFSAMASNVGCTSVGEPEMTRRISLVVVCCSSASRCSVSSLVFSIAMTA